MSGTDRLQAIDLETRGTDATHPDSAIVGIGVSNECRSVYVDMRSLSNLSSGYLRDYLEQSKRLIAFNVIFDASFLYRYCGKWLAWEADTYGLFKQLSSEGFTGQRWNLETLQKDVLGWPSSNKDVLAAALAERKLGKGDMWQLPPEILGPYCAQDAEAALQGHKYLTQVCRDNKFDALLDYHRNEFMDMARLMVTQQHAGITVDVESLQSHMTELGVKISHTMQKFHEHSQVAPVIARFNETQLAEYRAKEPEKNTKDGKVSARWQAWSERAANVPKFNCNSKKQLAWLLYDQLGMKVYKKTKGGIPAVDKKVLPSLGEPGKILTAYSKLVKEQGYVTKCLSVVRDGKIYPQFRWPGTVTGRPSGGGGFNMLQQPKTKGYLQCLKAGPGKKLVQVDFSALEPTILAEFSQCPAMLSIYGEGRPENDIYLFNACHMGALGDEIRKYYDPVNPSRAGIEAAKKHCKKQRDISKLVTLSSAYGAGASSIYEGLMLAGVDIKLAEVKAALQNYWQLYRGVKQFEVQLLDMWRQNDGWIINGAGLPMTIAQQSTKDILNRFCQGTAGAFITMYVRRVYQRCTERGIQLTPWLPNFYDETIGECDEKDAEAAAQIYRECLVELNEFLGMTINLKGEPQIADNLAEIKGAK
jgi:DNA polymerase I-like protein with 3'-5' exonuclease and polymerase domains